MSHNNQQQSRQCKGEKKGQEKREEKGREEREGREGEVEQEEKARKVAEEGDQEAKKEVMDWRAVRSNKRQRKRTIQIFVKVDVMTKDLNLSPEDKVHKILNTVSGSDQDVCVTRHGRALRRSEKLKSCGVIDGCTIQVTSKMRGVWCFSRVRRTK